MRLIMFSKMLKERSPSELISLAKQWDLGGYDLCVRPGYAVNPENAADELPRVAEMFRAQGLDIPMVTGNFDLLEPDHPTAEPLMNAMSEADIPFLKLGYFKYNPATQDYLAEVGRVRQVFLEWETLARRHGVRVCYHTHSNKCLGLNGAGLAHLLEGRDPELIGAYIDPAHLLVEGEDIDTALGMIKPWLSLVAVKDVLLTRVETEGHGSVTRDWVVAGRGMVNWTKVFACLRDHGYDGPISVHCEFEVPDAEFLDTVGREIAFFNRFVNPED